MNKTLRIVLSTILVLILSAGLVFSGIWIGRSGFNPFATYHSTPGWGMRWARDDVSCGGPGNLVGSGWMGRFSDLEFQVEPLSIAEVERILADFLTERADSDLYVSEVMIFDNHAYAQIMEGSTGIGALEVLVDHQSRVVYPEHGPNRMWNLKYGHMAGGSSYHRPGMMGYRDAQIIPAPTLDDLPGMPINDLEAIAAAQEYLDQYASGYLADDHPVEFYGYYTLHILDGNQVVGMLSVNGFSGQVFFHSWHGKLLEMDGH